MLSYAKVFHLKKALKNLTLENSSCIDNIMLSLEKRLKERSWIVNIFSYKKNVQCENDALTYDYSICVTYLDYI